MKNIVIIDRDTERKPVIRIGKPDDPTKPEDKEGAKKNIIDDISTTTDGLMTLVRMAHDGGYMDADKAAALIVKYFTEEFLTEKETEQS